MEDQKVISEKQVEPEKSVEEFVKEMVADPKVRANARLAATELNEIFRGNWFTITQLQKKSNYKSFEAALDLLNVFCLLELAYREEKLKGVIKYKITLSPNDKLALLIEEKEETEQKLADINANIERMRSIINN